MKAIDLAAKLYVFLGLISVYRPRSGKDSEVFPLHSWALSMTLLRVLSVFFSVYVISGLNEAGGHSEEDRLATNAHGFQRKSRLGRM